jgi:hypothetical protein
MFLLLVVVVVLCMFMSYGFNAAFNNSSAISWWQVLLVEATGENHRPVAGH